MLVISILYVVEKYISHLFFKIAMPNVLDIPMKKTEDITISDESAYAVFTARKARIEVNSTMNRGIQVNSSYKSEQVSIGINDNYLASVTYKRRSHPIYIIASVFFLIVGLLLVVGSSDDSGTVGLVVCVVLSLMSLFLFYYTRMARLSFRLADEQDYDILLASSAVNDSDLMQLFIQKVLMNSLKVEGFVSDIKPNQKVGIQKEMMNKTTPQQLVQPVFPNTEKNTPQLSEDGQYQWNGAEWTPVN